MGKDVILEKKIVTLREEFHKCAEEGWLEFETTYKIIKYLKNLGYELIYGKKIHNNPIGRPKEELIESYSKKCKGIFEDTSVDMEEVLNGYTGVVATLDTGKKGPTVAFRFDIDAIKSKEKKEGHRPYEKGFASKNPNVSHLCGHDGHIAIGIALAEYIMKEKENMRGIIKLIFQPAEESVRGARSMVEAGMLKDVDYIFSGHLGIINDDISIGVRAHNMLATNKINVTFRGHSAHAGVSPEMGRNALLAAASCILNLHSQVQFGSGVARLNVGVLHSGTGKNVIADKAVLELETRGETNEINDRMLEIVNSVVKGTAMSFGVESDIEVLGSAKAYNCEKDEFSNRVIDLLKGLHITLKEDYSFGASEDVTYMLEEVKSQGGKGMFFLFPSRLTAPHHNPAFDFQDESLTVAYNTYVTILKAIEDEKLL